ncbi:uncharacterized protein PFL1_04738 [Pseudozyma flocculosa PF-1]|uniref:Related to Superoxide dismutase n=2 Tax=Pseudozyma flocculosa TaxID=84751 RepID=A0A5C3F444_9BASI|nr:uncharacterized protein PFL1_04738 [Pseudozyma flocculosa PF-1]EPQ27600.1 hypothetical protein PFL1_04738 [Pseudozyma flocculosa PF-1]SPO39273.1 related to Superoxide dismutase [Pseudozyma flocculosa]
MSVPSLFRSSLRRSLARPLVSASASTSALPSASPAAAPAATRQLHSVPPMPELLDNGCAPFLSQQTVHQIANEWQAGLLDLLNQEVRDTEYATSSIVETVIGLSQSREKILAFNYASQALNNSFFLSSIAPQGSLRNTTPLVRTSDAISKSFNSYPEMCLAFSSAAFGMSGSGWVWLVTDQSGNLGVVPTYGAGTVVVQNRMQQGKHFALPSINDGQGGPEGTDPNAMPAAARPGRPSSARLFATEVGKELYPLLNISVHEHAWLNDYGIMGKEEYLTRFWNCVNWDRVEERFKEYCPSAQPLH